MMTVNQIAYPWRNGLTVSELIDELKKNPRLSLWVTGELVVILDGRHLSEDQYQTVIPDESALTILPYLAGG